MKPLLAALFVLQGFALSSLSATDDFIPARQDQPPNQPYSPAEAVSKMTVPDGFHVDLVASEPEIVNPIAMTFDERGRIWITESVEYPRKSAGPGRDRVKLLQDFDPSGRAGKVNVFAEGFNIPTGIAVGYGGIWVVNSPDLLFLREKNGKEISREVVLTGFGRTDSHELPSSLTWGPDGWLYGLNGVFNQSHVISKNGKRHDFTCAMWRLNPRTREFQVVAEGTSNPYGIAWDAEGSAIIEACHWANDHLFHFVETGYYERQAGAYPPFTMKIGSITDHGHQKTAYCGIASLDTGAFPSQYRKRIVVGNLHGGCINVDRLERDGATYLAKAEPDLLAANDAWFMPVSLKIGPDGCLYILDWYDRYHCSQDAARDPAGVDRLRGRLYRLRYGPPPPVLKFDLATESDEKLMARLGGANIYFRETAQRLLTERLAVYRSGHSEKLRSKLERLATIPPLPRRGGEGRGEGASGGTDEMPPATTPSADKTARLHAFWSLIGSGSLNPAFHEKVLAGDDATFRAWAVRAAGNYSRVAPTICQRVAALALDPSPDVQLQVAIASRKIAGCDGLPLLVDVLNHCGQDKLIPSVVWPNLHPLLETDAARFGNLVKTQLPLEPTAKLPPALATLMPRAIERILSAAKPDAGTVALLLEKEIQGAGDCAPDCIAAISGRIDGLDEPARSQLRNNLQPILEPLLNEERSTPLRFSAQLLAARLQLVSVDAAEVRRRFVAENEPDATRLQALEALVAFRDPSLLDSVAMVLGSSPSPFVARVLFVLGHMDEPRLADLLLAQYPNCRPELQPLLIDLIMQREPWTRKLLDAVLQHKLPSTVLNANHLRKILESDDREAIWAVEKAFGKIREERNPEREKVVSEMGDYLRKNIGNPFAGQRVFRNFCAQCHTIYGEGGKVGPDLTSNGRGSFDQVVTSVFDPSLVIGPGYQTVTVVTKDGRNLTGLVLEDSPQRIVLNMPGEGQEAVPRNLVKYTRVSKLSMMPEGIETLLPKQDLSDLFAFLALDKPPTDPAAKPIPGAPLLQQPRASSGANAPQN